MKIVPVRPSHSVNKYIFWVRSIPSRAVLPVYISHVIPCLTLLLRCFSPYNSPFALLNPTSRLASSHSPRPHALNFPVGFLVDYRVMRVSLTIVHAFYHPLPKHRLPYKVPGGCRCGLNILFSSANVTYWHFNALALTVYCLFVHSPYTTRSRFKVCRGGHSGFSVVPVSILWAYSLDSPVLSASKTLFASSYVLSRAVLFTFSVYSQGVSLR